MRYPLPLLAILALICSVSPAVAQAGSCNVVDSRLAEREMVNGVPLIRLEGPFLVQCAGGAQIRALTGTLNELTSEIELVGEVFFEDPDRTLTADRATYSSRLARLHALGNVIFVNRAEGSTLRGPELEYYRKTDARPQTLVVAIRRPHLTLVPRDADENAEPLDLDGDSVTITGRDNLVAVGNVIITQSEIRAISQVAHYDGRTEDLELFGAATVTGNEFALSGDTIDVDIVDSEIRTVHAAEEAILTGEDLEVTAPDLQLFFAADSLQRLVARSPAQDSAAMDSSAIGRNRPLAISETFRLEADSLDALLPGQQLEQVIAVGNARGEAIDQAAVRPPPAEPDSLGDLFATVPPVMANDWVVGDTITAYFAAAASSTVPDESPQTQLRKLVAAGSAQALYRAVPENTQDPDSAEDPPSGVNYLSGKVIELNFEEGELQLAVVTSLRRGMYLEPVPVVAEVPVDSAAAGGSRAAAEGAVPDGK